MLHSRYPVRLKNVSESTFALAIDVGNSRVTAAVVHDARDAYDNIPALFSLSASEYSASCIAFVDDNGALTFGDTAAQHGLEHPHLLAREFLHDVGNDIPVMIGPHAIPAEDLVARVCGWVVDEVSASEGAQPTLIAVTYPDSWGGHRLERLRAALGRARIDDPVLLSGSEASVRQLEAVLPPDPGQLLAVYDLGGTTFDARVLRRRSVGRYQPMGEQVRIEHLGGANFDDALMRHVLGDGAVGDGDVPLAAIADVRREVISAKKLLSSAGDATVHLARPSSEASVRVTRSELEDMITADIDRTIDALDLAIESAAVPADHVHAIILSGGSSCIPLVAQRLSERFDLPLIADADTAASTVLGAARIAGDMLRVADAADASADDATSTALVPTTRSDKAEAPRPEREPQRAGMLALLRPLFSKPSRSTSPLLLAGAAVFIAVSIVFSSTTAAGTRWPDFVQEAATTILHLPMSPAPAMPTPSPATAATTPKAPDTDGTISAKTPTRTLAKNPSKTPATTPAKSFGAGPKIEPTTPPGSAPTVVPVSKPAAATTPDTTTPTTTTPDTTTPPATTPDTTTPDTTTPPATTPDTTTTTPDTTTPDSEPPAETAPPVENTPSEPTPLSDTPADPAPADTPATEPTQGPAADPL